MRINKSKYKVKAIRLYFDEIIGEFKNSLVKNKKHILIFTLEYFNYYIGNRPEPPVKVYNEVCYKKRKKKSKKPKT